MLSLQLILNDLIKTWELTHCLSFLSLRNLTGSQVVVGLILVCILKMVSHAFLILESHLLPPKRILLVIEDIYFFLKKDYFMGHSEAIAHFSVSYYSGAKKT